jgi:alpha-1,6-mannosyltransferase
MYKYKPVLDGLLMTVIAYHLYVSSFTKVEESFNIQAVHDMLNYGVFPHETVEQNYDHIQFPGAVPRSFVGAILISGVVKMINFVTSLFGYDFVATKDQTQVLKMARAVLGLANGVMLMRVRNSIDSITFRDKKSKIKGLIGFWFMVLLLSQFHVLYYSSRTLPNFVALPFVSFAISQILKGDYSGITWLAFAGTVFRLEIGVFATIIAIVSTVGFGQSSLGVNFIMLVAGSIYGAIVTVSIDSYFWGKLVFPELEAFYFNVILGKSVEWGVEPWGAYFKSYLFQLFRPPVMLLLLIPGFINDPADTGEGESNEEEKPQTMVFHPARYSLRILFISAILFIATMSFQPHKEWRFIIYTIPVLTLQAANGLTNISMKWGFSFSTKLLLIIILANVFIATFLSIFMGYVSSYNYPGGEAVQFVNSFVQSNYENQPVTIHMDVATCMTGANRFVQLHNNLTTYDKTETTKELFDLWNSFDILITDANMDTPSQDPVRSSLLDSSNWRKIKSISAFKTVTIAPLIKILQDAKQDPSTILTLANVVKNDLLNHQTTGIKNILNSAIILDDYLYVYQRVAEDKDLELKYETFISQHQPNAEVNAPEVEHSEQISFDEVKEDINEEIDEFEDKMESQLDDQL